MLQWHGSCKGMVFRVARLLPTKQRAKVTVAPIFPYSASVYRAASLVRELSKLHDEPGTRRRLPASTTLGRAENDSL